jgi:hypothetical protein
MKLSIRLFTVIISGLRVYILGAYMSEAVKRLSIEMK